MPKISVIVATKNCFDKIDTIMLSLFRQEEQDIEIICVDDCSDDGTLNLLQHYAEFDKRVKIIAQPKPIGTLPCCKVGLESATAPYALFLNGNHHVLLVQMFLIATPSPTVWKKFIKNIIFLSRPNTLFLNI